MKSVPLYIFQLYIHIELYIYKNIPRQFWKVAFCKLHVKNMLKFRCNVVTGQKYGDMGHGMWENVEPQTFTMGTIP